MGRSSYSTNPLTMLELLIECGEDSIGVLAGVFLVSSQRHLGAEELFTVAALKMLLLCKIKYILLNNCAISGYKVLA